MGVTCRYLEAEGKKYTLRTQLFAFSYRTAEENSEQLQRAQLQSHGDIHPLPPSGLGLLNTKLFSDCSKKHLLFSQGISKLKAKHFKAHMGCFSLHSEGLHTLGTHIPEQESCS